jgi:transposase
VEQKRDKRMEKREKKEKKERIVEEYLEGGVTLRELGRRYETSHVNIQRWIKEYKSERSLLERGYGKKEVAEIKRLRRELEDVRLANELLRAMIDIAEEEMGIDIRKKRGAKR